MIYNGLRACLLVAAAVLSMATAQALETERDRLTVVGELIPPAGDNVLPRVSWVVLSSSLAGLYEEKTAVHASGQFEFLGVPSGSYILLAQADGFRDSSIRLVLRSGGETVKLRLALGARLPTYPADPGRATVGVEELRLPKAARSEFQKASEASRKRHLADAAEHLQKAVRMAPRFFQAHNNLGAVYLKMGRYAEAHAAFSQAGELQPENAVVLKNLGYTLLMMSRPGEAANALRAADRLAPDQVSILSFLGEALYHCGQAAEAEAALRRALELDETYYPASYRLGFTLLRLDRPSEAAVAFELFLRTNRGLDPAPVRLILKRLDWADRSH